MSEPSSPSPRHIVHYVRRLRHHLQSVWQPIISGALMVNAWRQNLYWFLHRPLRGCVVLLVIGGLASVVAEYGYPLPLHVVAFIRALQVYVVWGFLIVFLLRLGLVVNPWAFLKQHKIQSVLMLLLLLDLATFHTMAGQRWLGGLFRMVDVKQLAVFYVAFIQGVILLVALFEGAYYSRILTTWQIRPAQTLVISFVFLIGIGSALLMLPNASSDQQSVPFLTALFTATSAVCVTGLIVVDTATYFTPLGQGIILVLLQVGGLGIITFATVIGMMMRGGLGIREKLLLQDFLISRQFGEISTTVRRIIGLTLLLEMLGAISLFYSWQTALPDTNRRLWHAVFHAVSAFCNAGFSTFSDNLATTASVTRVGVNLTIICLIVLGGLGFSVLWEGGQWIRSNLTGRAIRLSIQSRLVLLVSGLLIGMGAVLLALLEADGVLAEHASSQRLLATLFQSVTARTAGFNTLPIEAFSVPATVMLLILMLIGASPGSTGGGLKTTTVALLFLTTIATIRGKARVEVLHRTLPWPIINQAYATFFFTIAFITLSMFILSTTESAPFLDLFFEEVSAFATVGLSRGVTATLSAPGQLVIIVSMFVGRVGSITLAVALARQVTTTAYEYPTESIMVG